MKKARKLTLWIAILVVVAFLSIYFVVRILQDPTRLTPKENEWINNNLNKVQNVSVVNDTNVFGQNGMGVFYDFLEDFSEQYGLKINSITYNSSEKVEGIQFRISDVLQENEVNFYQDHYVLIAKKDANVSLQDLPKMKVGVLTNSLSYIRSELEEVPSFVSYDTREDLLKALDYGNEINGVIVPRMEFMDSILSKNYFITAHFSNIYRYYNLLLDEENEVNFSNVLRKFFQKWNGIYLEKAISYQEFQLFVKSLAISQTEVDRLQGIVYQYGFLNTHPYEILSGGNFGGIIASYLSEFSKFSNIEFSFKRYRNYKSLASSIANKNVDIYYGYYTFTDQSTEVSSNILMDYDILFPLSDQSVVTSLKSLKGKTLYVEENSLLHSRLSSNEDIILETYSGEKGLKAVIKNRGILLMDHHISSYYQSRLLKDYSVRYTSDFAVSYSFKIQGNDTFAKLFMKYVDYLDENEMKYAGIYNHNMTQKHGTLLGTMAKYFLYIAIALIFIFYFLYRSSKRIRLVKKIRREDKMKYIDQLTSLKNRNYLNENIAQWNANSIYPQSVIVMNLNRIQDINDTAGYEQGDAQIKAAANILIKIQLDNSDIMRTDGNEFMIYLVGYQSKQISSFIHKLNKEFKNLPYDYGASIGYSMIVDEIKSIEDAINEAIEDVKKQKEILKEEQNYEA